MRKYYDKQVIFYVFLIFLFSALSISLILRHEPWRDETRPWLYARDYNMQSYFITREIYGATYPIEMTHIVPSILLSIGLPYSSVSVTNFLVMLTSIILLLIYAPFSKLQKTLFVFGYYIFYEYNVLARSWAFSILFLFCLAVFYKDRLKRPAPYHLFLFLLALTHIYVFILAVILAIVYYFELFLIKQDNTVQHFTRTHLFCIILLFIGFFYIFYPTLHPKNVPSEFSEWHTELSIRHLGTIPTAVIDAFLPIPKLQINFWQSRGISRALYGLPIFLLTLLFFIKKIKPLLIYLTLCSSLFAIFFFRVIGAFRHHGLIFIIFIFCLWIKKEYKDSDKIRVRINNKTLNILFILFLSIQVIAAGVAFYYDWYYDFSPGPRVAQFLKNSELLNDKTFVASFPSVVMAEILVYTPEYPKFYFIEYNDFRSFMVTDKNTYDFNAVPHPLSEITEIIKSATKNKEYQSILLILDKRIEPAEQGAEQYNLIASFQENIINHPVFIYKKAEQTLRPKSHIIINNG